MNTTQRILRTYIHPTHLDLDEIHDYPLTLHDLRANDVPHRSAIATSIRGVVHSVAKYLTAQGHELKWTSARAPMDNGNFYFEIVGPTHYAIWFGVWKEYKEEVGHSVTIGIEDKNHPDIVETFLDQLPSSVRYISKDEGTYYIYEVPHTDMLCENHGEYIGTYVQDLLAAFDTAS